MLPHDPLSDGTTEVSVYKMLSWPGDDTVEKLRGYLGSLRPRDEGYGEDVLEDPDAEAEMFNDLGLAVSGRTSARPFAGQNAGYVCKEQYTVGQSLDTRCLRRRRSGSVSVANLAGSEGSTGEESSDNGCGSVHEPGNQIEERA